MKAIRVHAFGSPEVLKLEEISDLAPGPGQIVVRIRAAGVNPVETYIRSGIYGARQFPYTPGSDAGGIIESVGLGVAANPGDRVSVTGSLTGSYAQLALCTAMQVFPLPENLSFAQGAAIGVPYGTACRALFTRGGATAGETVLVHGASGGVGTASVQLARHAGLRVIGTASTDRGRQLVRDQGAEHVLDHSDKNYLQQLMDLTNGRGVDLILEMLANVNLGKDLTVLAKRGRVVVIGSRGPVEINSRDTMSRDADIRGMSLAHADERERVMMYMRMGTQFAAGTLKPIVGQEIPLAEAPRAHEAVMKSGSHGKIVLVP
ncbi:MAG TPA: NADPH:quinone reductase [Tepidisphaeraceae bacterium]|nr:NADPH:quinone reductase [Tepidisphaeraceae bacterium]